MIKKDKSDPVRSQNIKQLGKAIKARRTAAHLTVRGLAEQSGLTPATISRIETGQIDSPRPDHLLSLATALGTDLEDFYALAGYTMPTGLPELRPYLRSKYNLPDHAVEQLDEYFQALRGSWDHSAKETRHDHRNESP
jgi:transcriptional regulator with XRE-family HTH domain